MDIDLGQDVEFLIKYNGASYKMREPSVKETMALKDSNSNEDLIQFLSRLGMDANVLEAMPISKMKKLVESMLGAISEKK